MEAASSRLFLKACRMQAPLIKAVTHRFGPGRARMKRLKKAVTKNQNNQDSFFILFIVGRSGTKGLAGGEPGLSGLIFKGMPPIL